MPDAGAAVWMPQSKSFIASAIRKLVSEGEQRRACILLVRQACAGHFGVLASTLAELSDFELEGLKILLSERARGSYALQYAVSQTGVPEDLYPLLATAIDLARDARKAIGSALGPQAQSFLLKKILESLDVQALKLPDQFVAALLENIEVQPEKATLEIPGGEESAAVTKEDSATAEAEAEESDIKATES
jgi:hypothetical protein